MDAIFGVDKFLSEITWQRTSSHNDSKRFGQVRDIILFYSKTNKRVWNPVYVPHDDEYVSDFYRYEDDRGKYRLHEIIRTASMGPRPNLAYEYKGYTPEWGWRMVRDKLEALDQDGLLVWSNTGRPYRKTYLPPGRNATNLWDDIPNLSGNSPERTGYPTQKPVALAERIILASSNPGDVVLDCFAGCAYVPVAAERNGRQWIACDISPRALTVLRRQFAKFRYAVDGGQSAEQPALITDANVITHSPHDLPDRSDDDPAERHEIKELPERKYKVPSSLIPEKEMLEYLLKLSGHKAWCCGFANRRPNGAIVETANNFHLDHIDPKSKDGSNQIWNRAPLCPAHNVRKNNRRVHLAEYREEIANAGEMLVDTTADLINLAWAQQQAVDYYAAARVGHV